MTNHLSTYLAKEQEDKVKKQHRLRSQQRSDEDVFLDILIDELKMENKDLKFALVAREEKLMVLYTKFDVGGFVIKNSLDFYRMQQQKFKKLLKKMFCCLDS